LIENITYIKNKKKDFLKINNSIEIFGENGQYCKITPANDFIINITIDFEGIIGRQAFSYAYKETKYLEEISIARSMFAFEISKEDNPWKNYKIQFESFPYTVPDDPKDSPYIAYTDKEFLTPLKDSLEPVKHKLLDFIGDIMLLGKMPQGKFELYKPGHAFNRKIVDTLFNLDTSWDLNFEYFSKKIPEINLLKNYIENNIVHKNEDVLSHTKNVFKNTFEVIKKYNLKINDKEKKRFLLATFLHDYGKKETLVIQEDGTTSCKGHEVVSVKCILAESLLERFSFDDNDKKWILNFIKNHAEIHNVFVEDDHITNKNLDDFEKKCKDSFIENLIFGISDIKGTYFEIFNRDEYKRRINLLENKLKMIPDKIR
jgi:hypothetical protein